MEQAGDILLFQRIRLDDRTALNALFSQYYTKLCRFACSCSITREQAEEIVSDVFFMIWKNRERIDIRINVRAYLYACVRNAAIALSRQRPPEITLSDEHDKADMSTPDMHILYEELHTRVQGAVEKLPARCKQIFIMNRMYGLKYKEIASILSISEKTVEHQVAKALELVRFALQPGREYQVHNSVTV